MLKLRPEASRAGLHLSLEHSAIRAQRFVAFTRQDLETRQAKAAELAQQLYPDHTRRLRPAEFEAFFSRLMADTERRAHNRWGGEGWGGCPLLSLLGWTAHSTLPPPVPSLHPAGTSWLRRPRRSSWPN